MNKKNLLIGFGLIMFLCVSGYLFFVRNITVDQEYEQYFVKEAVPFGEVQYPENRKNFEFEVYTVKEGDTLESIANAYGLDSDSIHQVNGMVYTSVTVGQNLRIPPEDGSLVVVHEGDTLSSIAELYQVKAQKIADFNWLDYPFELEIGSEIFIPGGEFKSPLPDFL